MSNKNSNIDANSRICLNTPKPERRSRSLSPTIGRLASNMCSVPKSCMQNVNKVFGARRREFEFENIDESILNTPEREKYITETFRDNQEANYRDYLHHTSDMYKIFRRDIMDERKISSKCHKKYVSERDRLNLLIRKLMYNHEESSRFMTDKEKQEAFDALVDLQKQKRDLEELMVQSVLQTESHDQFTEDLMKDAERSKKKQEYKRVEKVINQDPNSQDASTSRGSSKIRDIDQQQERDKAIVDLALVTMRNVKKIEDQITNEVLEADRPRQKKMIRKKVSKALRKQDEKQKKDLRKNARKFTKEGNFITRAFQSYKERRAWNKEYKKQMRLQKKSQGRMKQKNWVQRAISYLDKKFSNGDEILKFLHDEEAALSLHDKMILESYLRSRAAHSDDLEVFLDARAKSRPVKPNAIAHPGSARRRQGASKEVNRRELGLSLIGRLYSFPEVPESEIEHSKSETKTRCSATDDSMFEGDLPCNEIRDSKSEAKTRCSTDSESMFEGDLPCTAYSMSEKKLEGSRAKDQESFDMKDIDLERMLYGSNRSSMFDGDLPCLNEVNRPKPKNTKIVVHADVEPEPRLNEVNRPKPKNTKIVVHADVEPEPRLNELNRPKPENTKIVVHADVEPEPLTTHDCTNRPVYRSPVKTASSNASSESADAKNFETFGYTHYATPACIESCTSENSSEKLLETEELEIDHAIRIPPDPDVSMISLRFQKYLDHSPRKSILDIELSPEMIRSPMKPEKCMSVDRLYSGRESGHTKPRSQKPLTLSDLEQTTSSSSNMPTSSSSSPGLQTDFPLPVYFQQPSKDNPTNSGNRIFDRTISRLKTKQRREIISGSTNQRSKQSNVNVVSSDSIAAVNRCTKTVTEFGPEVKSYTYEATQAPASKQNSLKSLKQAEADVDAKSSEETSSTSNSDHNQLLRKLENQLQEQTRIYKKIKQKADIQRSLDAREAELRDWRSRSEKKALSNQSWRQEQELLNQKNLIDKQKDHIARQKAVMEQALQNQFLAHPNKDKHQINQTQPGQNENTRQSQAKDANDREIRQRAAKRREAQRQVERETRKIQDSQAAARLEKEKQADLLRIDQEYAMSSLGPVENSSPSSSTSTLYYSAKSAYKNTRV